MKSSKKVTAIFLVLAMMMSLGGYAAPSSTEVPATSPSGSANEAEMQRLTNRLEEIRAMDVENMPRSEKKKYKKEVKQIQKRMNAIGGGVYISAGALILILILLIIFV